MKLILSAALFAALTVQLALADDGESVRVSEACDRVSCSLTIAGPDVPCVKAARKREWVAGYVAAVWIRDCMDRKVEAKLAQGGGQ